MLKVYEDAFHLTARIKQEDGFTTSALTSASDCLTSASPEQQFTGYLALHLVDKTDQTVLSDTKKQLKETAAKIDLLGHQHGRDLKWGRQPLLRLVQDSDEVISEQPFFRELLTHFRDDEIPGNAYGTAEILKTALNYPELNVIQILANALVEETQTELHLSQYSLRLSSLFLSHYIQYGSEGYELLYQPDEETKSLLLKVSTLVLKGLPETTLNGNHSVYSQTESLALSYLRSIDLFPEAEITEILSSDLVDKDIRIELIAEWLVQSPSSLFDIKNHHYFAKTVALDENIFHRGIRRACEEVEEPAYYGYSRFYDRWTHRLTPVFCQFKQQAVSAVRNELRNTTEAHSQINLAKFLIYSNDRESLVEIAEAIVSNFADDDIRWNRSESNWLLYSMDDLEETELEPVYSVLEAGLNVGVRMEDWQMTVSCLRLIEHFGRHYQVYENEPLMDFVLENMADDDVPQNGADAYHILRRGLPDTLPWIEKLAAEGDEQQQLGAQRLLENRYSSGFGF